MTSRLIDDYAYGAVSEPGERDLPVAKVRTLSPEEQAREAAAAAEQAAEEAELRQERERKMVKKLALEQTRQQIVGADSSLEAAALELVNDGSLPMADRLWAFCVNLGQPIYSDLVSDVGCEGSTPTLIDGDSLLFDVLCDARLDWAHGGQFGHLIYLVEAFLAQWSQLGMSASVLFFEQTRQLWRDAPQALLLRQLVINHLQANTDVPVNRSAAKEAVSLPAPWSDEFRDHVFMQQPNCFIVSDGQAPPGLSPHAPLPSADRAHLTFAATLFHALARNLGNLTCCLTKNLKQKDAHLIGFVFTPKQAPPQVIFDSIRELQAQLPDDQSSGDKPATALTMDQLIGHLEQQLLPSLDAVEAQLFKLYVLHLDLVEALPVSQRQVRLDYDVPRARAAGAAGATVVHSLLQKIERALLAAPAPLPAFDYLDGRLFWRLIELRAAGAALPATDSYGGVDLAARLAAVTVDADFFAGFERCAVAPAAAAPPAIDFTSQFYAALFPQAAQWSTLGEQPVSVGQALLAGHVAAPDFVAAADGASVTTKSNEPYLWKTGHLEAPDAHTKIVVPTDPRERRRQQRSANRYIAFLHRYASGLHAANELAVRRPTSNAAPAADGDDAAGKKKGGKGGKGGKSQAGAGGKAHGGKAATAAGNSTGPGGELQFNNRADEIKYWNSKRREHDEIKSEIGSLENNRRVFTSSPEETGAMIDKFIVEAKSPISRAQGKLYALKLAMRMWADAYHTHAKKKGATSKRGGSVERSPALSPRSGLVYAIRASRLAFEIVADYFQLPATTQAADIVGFCQQCLVALGFADALPALKGLLPASAPASASASASGDDVASTDKKKGGAGRGGKGGKGGKGGASKLPQRSMKPKDIQLPEDIKLKIPTLDVGQVHTGVSFLRFQLEFCGPQMDRGVPVVKDDRVAFVPEDWQKELIDVVDTPNTGALVVAPTSSGKTFVSYYAMKKVLLDNDDDVVVYVAPTQALVEQVAADIFGKFGSKQYPDRSHRRLWGIYVPNYRQNALNSQVLVTVPQVFESLLLSADHANPNWNKKSGEPEKKGPDFKPWLSRIRYIILDEIHCMGNLEGGQMWERIVSLARAPIIGLSATVGNPQALYEWMRNSQAARGLDLRLINHKYRFSHLYYYQYQADKACRGQDLDSLQSVHPAMTNRQSSVVAVGQPQTSCLERIHPIGCLSANDIERGNLRSLDLPPDSAMRLYDTLVQMPTLDDSDRAELQALAPEAYWSDIKGLVNYMHVRDWAARLKGVVQRWSDLAAVDRACRHKLDRLLDTLHAGTAKVAAARLKKSGGDGDSAADVESTAVVPSSSASSTAATPHDPLFKLLLEMNEHDLLPMLGFSFDRYLCEHAFDTVLAVLRDLEEKKRASMTSGSKQQKMTSRLLQKTASSRNEAGSDPDDDEFEEEIIGEPTGPLPEFSFVKPGYFADSFNTILETIKDNPEVTADMIEGLRRGIGLHHDSLPTKYLRCVETLFRMRHLRVVFCTKTLTMGINMPCRAVVFLSDSVYLNPMYFQQMSGRSGRRGYDQVGHVVFFNILWPKIQRLMVSGLPTLSGGSLLNLSFVARLLCYYNSLGGQAKPEIENVLRHRALAGAESPARAHFSQHFIRFTLEYLLREGLMDQHGQLLGFSGLLLHLYALEPANLQLVALFQRGYFHDLCSAYQSTPAAIHETLLVVLAHLFGASFWVGSNLPGIPGSNTDTFVELPAQARSLLDAHKSSTLRLINATLKQLASVVGPPTELLPLAAASSSASSSSAAAASPSALNNNAALATIQSAHCPVDSSELRSYSEMLSSIRPDFRPFFSSFPDLANADNRDRKLLAKDYLLHFWNDGSMLSLIARDRIPRSQVWYLLYNFDFTLKIIVEVLLCRQQSIDERIKELEKAKAATQPAKAKGAKHGVAAPSVVIASAQNDDSSSSEDNGDVVEDWEDILSEDEAGPEAEQVSEQAAPAASAAAASSINVVRELKQLDKDRLMVRAFRDLSLEFTKKFKASMVVK